MKKYSYKKFDSEISLKLAISTVDNGSMKETKGNIDTNNLGKFLKASGLQDNGICMEQVHDGFVEVVNNNNKTLISGVDGLVSNKRNLPLVVVTADCLPVVFYDLKNHVIGVAHAGRRGLEKNIIENILKKLQSEFGSDSKNIIVGIGPGIEKKCYEVDGELLDIRQKAIDALLDNGVLLHDIESMNICTKCSDDFYSYRGGDTYKRFATVISLV